jgi:3',5'-nucleoside bisphosphate phosphatase
MQLTRVLTRLKMFTGIGGFSYRHMLTGQRNSLISQLGFVPPDINADALEISRHISKEEFLAKYP